MIDYSGLIQPEGIINILYKTLNHVDARLIDHGLRVAYIVYRMLSPLNVHSDKELQNICFLSVLHDIGAYKTDEIDRMVQFETKYVREHSIYGYLFVKYFSPIGYLAPAVLFHHTDWRQLKSCANMSQQNKEYAQIIRLADRADIFNEYGKNADDFEKYLKDLSDGQFHLDVIELYQRAGITFPLDLTSKSYGEFRNFIRNADFSNEEIDRYLKMIISAIDFRSYYTVTHTVTTSAISGSLAHFMGLEKSQYDEIVCGAMVHDLGKIGIPVEILEFPGKLSPQAMGIMRTHVEITDEILGDHVSPVVRNIAVRHHEKLDGSGYPGRLHGHELSTGERIVAAADIVSALCGVRSYKTAYPREKIIMIIRDMAFHGLIDSNIVDLIGENYDKIMHAAYKECTPVIEVYQMIQKEYDRLIQLDF